jgi:glycosyltransferase involved in cell wall biosynthesis
MKLQVLSGKNIIYFAKNTRWTGNAAALQTFAQHLARKLAEYNRVLWINPPSRNPRRFYRYRLQRVTQHLITYTPWIPFSPEAHTLNCVSAFIYAFQIRLIMKHLGVHQPMFWVANIPCDDLVGLLPRAPWIFSPVGDVLSEHDEAFAAHTVLLRAVSEPTYYTLREKFPDKTYLLPNGVDYDAWQDILCKQPAEPADLAAIPCPRAGFVGNVTEHRVDFALLSELARHNPAVSFVLVGPGEWTKLKPRYFDGLSNVYFLGAKPYQELPLYIRGFTVCLIPYLLNTFNRGTNPIKVYEYFALGKPVISTSIPSMLKYQPFLRIADTVQEFENVLRGLVASGNEETLAEQRRAIAQQHSPEATLCEIDRILFEKNIRL